MSIKNCHFLFQRTAAQVVLLFLFRSLPVNLLSYGVPPSGDGTGKVRPVAFVPAGKFIMGATDEEIEEVRRDFGARGDFKGYDFEAERPRRELFLKAFYMDRYEVTNEDYRRFVLETGYRTPRHWREDTFSPGTGTHPVILVSWFDAAAYCSWEGKRLPTDEEWEKAARGEDGRRYPWGNEYDPDNVVTAEYILKYIRNPRELTYAAVSVREQSGDKSPYGVYDMGGNVMEWTGSDMEGLKTKAVRGASWVHLHARARTAAKEGMLPEYSSHLVGFRCAMDGGEETSPPRRLTKAEIKDPSVLHF